MEHRKHPAASATHTEGAGVDTSNNRDISKEIARTDTPQTRESAAERWDLYTLLGGVVAAKCILSTTAK